MTYTPKIASFFSGAGLMDIGLIDSGCEITQAYELDQSACKTYTHNLGQHMTRADVSQEMALDKDAADVHVFTYPCTKYSTIADIHQTRTGDELYLHALRHLVLNQPEAYVLENVPGMRAFPIVMEAMTKLPDYYVQTFCPIESSSWLPQRRARLIIMGTKNPFGFRPPEGHRRVRLKEIIEKDADISIPKALINRMNGQYRDLPIVSDPEKDDIAPTCMAHYAKDKSTRAVVDKASPIGVRPYTVREYARLQGVPDWFDFPVSNTSAYKQIGNGVSVPVGRWVGSEIKRYFNRKVATPKITG